MAVSALETVPADIKATLATASRRTGADFRFLVETAARESSFDADAEARTSSATGLFQFIEQTWLKTVKDTGARHGLGDLAASIEKTASGTYTVADPEMRQQILDLRKDPMTASLMAGELTRANETALADRLGRPVATGERYIAHFLGVSGAGRLIEAAEGTPEVAADKLLPSAAAANRSIFYDAGGRARSAGEVYAKLTASKPGTGGAAASVPTMAPDATADLAVATRWPNRPSGPPAIVGITDPALRLSPEVVEILASLDPLAGRKPT